MKLISYYDKYSAENGKAQYLTLDIDSGTEVESPAESPFPDIDGTPAYKFGSSSDGKYTYIAAFKYTLRDDMERKIRRRLFRKDNETGELEEMFTKWDRSGLQMNKPTYIIKDASGQIVVRRFALPERLFGVGAHVEVLGTVYGKIGNERSVFINALTIIPTAASAPAEEEKIRIKKY